MKPKLPLYALLVALLFTNALGSTATDQSSSKNEIMAKGQTPHVRFFDDDGTGNYDLKVNGGVMRVEGLSGNPFFNLPPTGTVGIELTPPFLTSVTPASGGSLVDGTYFFVVVATDGGTGESNVSNEASCVIANPTTTKCTVVYSPVSMVVTNYRIYKGTTGAENLYKTQTCTSGPCTFDWTSDSGAVSKTVPVASTAYFAKLTANGIVFIDGSSQSTAGGAGAWAFSGANILSAATGNVGIFDGVTPFSPVGKLSLVGDGINTTEVIDSYGFSFFSDVVIRHADGSFASPAAASGVSAMIGRFGVRSYDGSSFPASDTGYIQWRNTQPHSGTALGNRLDFATTLNNTTTPTIWMTLGNDGSLTALGSTFTFGNTGSTTVSLVGTSGTTAFDLGNGTSGEAAILTVNSGSASTSRFDLERGSGTDRFRIDVAGSAATFSWTGTNLTFEDNLSNIYAEIKSTALSGETNLVLIWFDGATTRLRTVVVGGNNSCGSGQRCLTVPNA